ncbi:MAG: protein-disulfide reductase DsbD domain-containing protein [Methyloligellaceae bacterium]
MAIQGNRIAIAFIRASLTAAAIIASGFAILAGVTPAGAGSASDWESQSHVTMRLIADTAKWRDGRKALVAGIHIKLDEGWKTYWRYPGDSGLPPTFDWSDSRNLKVARLLWPAPTRLRDSAGTSYGYKKEVIFPVLIEPVEAGQPIDVRLKMEFAVCADICIPAEADLQLKVGKDGWFSRSYGSLLSRYLARVPGKQARGSRTGLSVSHTEARLSGVAPYLAIDARFPVGAQDADLFVEGPEGFYLAPAELVDRRSDGTIRFKVDLTKGDDPKDLNGKTVTLTLVSKSAQAETSWRIE